MFLVNCVQCNGHSLSGPWGCGSLVNSVVRKPPMRMPSRQSSLCDLSSPSASGLSGNRLLQILQEGVKSLVGTVGSRTRASSLCSVLLSFNELMQVELLGPTPPIPIVSKDSRTFPGGSQGNCSPPPPPPPAQRPCSASQLRASCSQHRPESSLQMGKHTVPQA